MLLLLLLTGALAQNASMQLGTLNVTYEGATSPPLGGMLIQMANNPQAAVNILEIDCRSLMKSTITTVLCNYDSIEISDSGMDYITAMTAHAVPSLLLNLQLPALSGGGFEISKLKITEMSEPNITSRFVAGVGIYSEFLFPEIMMTGRFSAGLFWSTKEGAFKGVVKNLRLEMLVTLENGPDGAPVIIVPNCNAFTDDILLVFGGGFSAVLNTVRGFLESFLRTDLGLILCDLMIQTTKAVEAEMGQVATAQQRAAEEGEEFDPAMLCGSTRLREKDKELGPSDFSGDFRLSGRPQFTDSHAVIGLAFFEREKDNELGPSDFSGDFRLSGRPQFTDSHAVIGLRGEILYRNQSAELDLEPIRYMPQGERMVSFLITEYLVNTFFKQAYLNELGTISETLTTRDFPPMMQAPLDLVCWGCKIELRAGISPGGQVPQASFTTNGVLITVEGEFRVIVDGPFRKFDFFRANIKMEILARPYIQDNAIFAKQLKLSNYATEVKSVGLGGVLGEPVQEVLDMMVPRKVWPQLKKKLRVALHQRGLRLPIICGLRLRRTVLRYEHDVVVVDTDFQYNLNQFLSKIRKVITLDKKTPS